MNSKSHMIDDLVIITKITTLLKIISFATSELHEAERELEVLRQGDK